MLYDDNVLTIINAEVVPDINIIDRKKQIGKFWSIDDGKPTVICGSGLLKLTEIHDNDNNEFLFKKLKIKIWN